MLSERDWYIDGTFFLLKNLDYQQVFIISVLYSENNKTFTYPIAFTFMRYCKIENYEFFYNFIKEKFHAKYGFDLKPRCARMDCESAIISSIKKSFGKNQKIRLCTIHIQRSWWKKFNSLIGKKRYIKHVILRKIWHIINGLFYLPINCIAPVFEYCQLQKNLLSKPTQKKVDEFLYYLLKNYFSANSFYHVSYWSYYSDISELSEFNISSNTAESVNKKLKVFCIKGTINFHRACKTLKKFKTSYVTDFESQVRGDKLNPRKSVTLTRENKILDIIREYDYLVDSSFLLEPDPETIINFALRLGTIGKSLDDVPDFENTDRDD